MQRILTVVFMRDMRSIKSMESLMSRNNNPSLCQLSVRSLETMRDKEAKCKRGNPD